MLVPLPSLQKLEPCPELHWTPIKITAIMKISLARRRSNLSTGMLLHQTFVRTILAAVFTVSPKSWNLPLSPRKTPATVEPE